MGSRMAIRAVGFVVQGGKLHHVVDRLCASELRVAAEMHECTRGHEGNSGGGGTGASGGKSDVPFSPVKTRAHLRGVAVSPSPLYIPLMTSHMVAPGVPNARMPR
jgi:hypothetical protein